MQFTSFSRSVDNLTITLYNETPIENVLSVKYYSDNSRGTFEKKEFRWSFNNVYWSSWQTLTQSNISKIDTHGNYYLFLQIRYVLTRTNSGTVTTFKLDYTAGSGTVLPTVIHQDIEIPDTSAVLIHDVIQRYQIVAITDACTLNGYPGSWYLNRANHRGYQPISSITGLQTIINSLISAAGVTQEYVDASLLMRDASIAQIIIKNNYQDVSLQNLYDTKQNNIADGTYLKESSIGTGFSWNAGYLDVSGGGDVTKIYVDGSLATLKTYDDARWIDIQRVGFMNQTDTSLLFEPTTGVFTLSTSTGLGSWKYLWKGMECTIDHDVSVKVFTTIPTTTRRYFIYIDSSLGTLSYKTTPWNLSTETGLPVAIIFYNSTLTPTYHLIDERHTCLIDRRIHYYLHTTRGTQYVSGGTVTGYTLNNTTDTSALFSIIDTVIADEDIVRTLSIFDKPDGSTLAHTIFYATGSIWSWELSEMPYLYESGSYIKWDSSGSVATGSDGKFYNYYLLYTAIDGSSRYVFVPGRSEFDTLEDAKTENPTALSWNTFAAIESVIAYKFIWEASSGLSTKGKVRLVHDPIPVFQPTTTLKSVGTGTYHNILSGIQGGNADASEYYHLSKAQYENLGVYPYLKESSIGDGFTWDNGYLDVSGGGDVTKAYVDGSLANLKTYDDARWIDINRNGFVNQTDTSISFNPTNYTFYLTKTGTSWKYLRQGIEYTIEEDRDVQLSGTPPTAGNYYIYIDSNDGGLIVSSAPWTLLDTKIPVALILYNSANSPTYHLADERHTCLIDRREHWYNHTTRGTQFVSGGTLTGPTVNGSTNADNTFGISQTVVADEDIIKTNAALTRPDGSTKTYNIFYRTNSSTYTWVDCSVPYLYSNYIQWDNAGTLTTGVTGKYYNSYLLFTTMESSSRFSMFPGRGEYDSLTEAVAESPLDFNFTGFPILESVIAYQFTWEASSGYTTLGKVRLAATPKSIRVATISTVGSAANYDHNTLAGLQGGDIGSNEFYHIDQTMYDEWIGSSYVDNAIQTERNYIDGSLAKKLNNTTDTFTGTLTINGSINLYGNFIQDGCAYVVHAEHVYTADDFITMRDGALVGLPDGSISGIRIKIPNGSNDVILGVNNDAVMRVGWDTSTLVALAAREDVPVNTWFARWDDSSVMFKTFDLFTYLDSSYALKVNVNSSLNTIWNNFSNYVSQSYVDGSFYTKTQVDSSFALITNVNSSLGNYVLKTGDTMSGRLLINASLNVTGNTFLGDTSADVHTVIGDMNITGDLTATTKSFLINHPTKVGKKLQYGNLEGAEHAVYYRGKYTSSIIQLPDYWIQLVDENTLTVNLTSCSKWCIPYVKDIKNNSIILGKIGIGKLEGFYIVFAERKDVGKLIVEK